MGVPLYHCTPGGVSNDFPHYDLATCRSSKAITYIFFHIRVSLFSTRLASTLRNKWFTHIPNEWTFTNWPPSFSYILDQGYKRPAFDQGRKKCRRLDIITIIVIAAICYTYTRIKNKKSVFARARTCPPKLKKKRAPPCLLLLPYYQNRGPHFISR